MRKRKRQNWTKLYGFTIAEMADLMHITRQRVWQLAKNGSHRIEEAIHDLQVAETLATRAEAVRPGFRRQVQLAERARRVKR